MAEGAFEVELALLKQRIDVCQQCPAIAGISKTRSSWRGNITPGVDVLFVGEAPGEVEDSCGVPFVGPCGKMLQEWVVAMKLREDQYAVTNVARCWPRTPEGKTRPPSTKEQAACRPFLVEFLRLLKPKVTVSVGTPAKTGLAAAGVKDAIHVKHPGWYIRGNPWDQDIDRLGLAIRAALQLKSGPNEGKYVKNEWD